MSPARRRIIDYGLAGLLLLIPAAILHATMKEPERLNGLDRLVLTVASPLQAAATWTIEGVGGLWTGYVWLVDTEEQNEALREENARLRHALAEAKRHAADTRSLEELIALERRTPAQAVGARVIAASLNPHFRVTRIVLDRGAGEVEPGMPVVSGGGLVGRVHHAYGDYSDVLLATDAQSSVDVLIPRTGGRGVLTGLGREDSYACQIEYLERGDEVVEGDLVVTSGLGSAFPEGLVVGHISRVTTKEYGLYQEVVVTPSVEFSSLSRVLVLTAAPPPPDPEAGQRDPRQAHGADPF